jgi:hypothetical protein
MEGLLYIGHFIKVKSQPNGTFFWDVLSVNFRSSRSVQSKLNIIATDIFQDYVLYNVYFNINSGTLYFS